MKQITEKAIKAFNNKHPFKLSNTEIRIEGEEWFDTVKMYLFGNCIAKLENDNFYICNGGYRATVTTRERLNGFPNIYIRKMGSKLILNEKIEITNEWTLIE